jgi:predicted ATPase
MPSNALDYISVEGFKSIASIQHLDLKPINVVIGPNGSGKSNFIGVFSFLHAIREGRLWDYVGQAGGAEKVLHFGSKTTKEIRLRLSFGREVNQYEIRLAPSAEDALFPSSETVYFWNKSLYPTPYGYGLAPRNRGREAGISDENSKSVASSVRDRLGSWRVYHVHDTSSSSPMRKTAKIDDNAFLRADGSNLAAFLYFLQQKHEASYSLIRGSIQRVAPFFDDFQLRPRQLKAEDIRLEWRHRNSEQYFDASSLSDGSLRFITLATLFLQPKALRPSVILVDEPELGLHPYAIGMLASLIRQASTDTQVIVSTQSSLLLDYFDPPDVLVASRVGSSTQVTRLDVAVYKEWLREYSLGQLWEKNELGGRPSPD